MGTRNLTVVVSGGAHRVAQYGQWDGYPSGQGATVLAFCRAHLTTPDGVARFREALGRCRFVTEEEADALNGTDWLTSHPHLSRDVGADILEVVRAATSELQLVDEIDFATNSLMCEWAYVVDLDKEVMEVYRGFNKLALDPSVDRFALRRDGEDPYAVNAVSAAGGGELTYQPVRMVASWPLSDLPQQDELVATADPPEPEEDDE